MKYFYIQATSGNHLEFLMNTHVLSICAPSYDNQVGADETPHISPTVISELERKLNNDATPNKIRNGHYNN